jgi:hypothetical protein
MRFRIDVFATSNVQRVDERSVLVYDFSALLVEDGEAAKSKTFCLCNLTAHGPSIASWKKRIRKKMRQTKNKSMHLGPDPAPAAQRNTRHKTIRQILTEQKSKQNANKRTHGSKQNSWLSDLHQRRYVCCSARTNNTGEQVIRRTNNTGEQAIRRRSTSLKQTDRATIVKLQTSNWHRGARQSASAPQWRTRRPRAVRTSTQTDRSVREQSVLECAQLMGTPST